MLVHDLVASVDHCAGRQMTGSSNEGISQILSE